MNRNTNAHFANLPTVDIQRSKLDRSHSHKLSGNVGDLIPIYVDADIMPGDTVSMDTSKIVRFQTMLTPVMDNIQADVYWFFVPHRLVWDHWINFMGENTASAWIPQTTYTVPKLRVPIAGAQNSNNYVGSILDYMGFPVGANGLGQVDINALPFRAYTKVCNDWFRKENITDPLNLYTGDSTVTCTKEQSYVNDVPKAGAPFKVAKYADYFTACNPSPQKGDAVEITLSGAEYLPVLARDNDALTATKSTDAVTRLITYDIEDTANDYYRAFYKGNNTNGLYVSNTASDFDSAMSSTSQNVYITPVNLWADPPSGLTFTVNDMRYAFQLQKLLEKDARAGSRYIEVIKSHFGVQSPDARLQRPEYLGGNRFGIVIDQVCNTAQTQTDFLGDLGAFSVSSDVHSDFTHSFTEHGTLLGLMCIRYDHTYAQGLEKQFMRNDRFSYYWPVFANIGEQPVLKGEIYCENDPAYTANSSGNVFGYQEAWAEYRYKPNRVSGEMRPYVQNGLFSWTLADDYAQQPSLSDDWIREDKTNVDRTLAVTSQVSNQFWADIYFNATYTRPMPVYSVPGLVDHH